MSYQPHNFQPGAVLLAEQLNEMDNEIARISGGEGALSENVKQSLLECFENVAWINDQGQTYYDNLYNALYPPLNIESISAVFDSGSNVIYDNMTLDDLKQYLTVTATLTDYSTQTVTDYVLSGNMTAGNQTITVSYGGKTTTFTVTVVEWLTSISSVFTQGSATIYDTDTLDTLRQYLVVTATYSDSTTAIVTDYTLSGTLTEGTSTITVSYGGKTDTFSVLVTLRYIITSESSNVFFGSNDITNAPTYHPNTNTNRISCLGANFTEYACEYGYKYELRVSGATYSTMQIAVSVWNTTAKTAVDNLTAGSESDRQDLGWLNITNGIDIVPNQTINGAAPAFIWLSIRRNTSNNNFTNLADIGTITITKVAI